MEQESQQAKTSGIDFPKCDVAYAESYNSAIYEEESKFSRRSIDLDGIKGHYHFRKPSRAITKNDEFAAVGSETDSNNEPESKLIFSDSLRGCSTTLTSSFENCADCKPMITEIQNS